MGEKPLLELVVARQDLKNAKVWLPEADANMFEEMIETWRYKRMGSQRHLESSFDRDVGVLFDMLRFTGKAPWFWNEEYFEKWCFEIGVTRISSQGRCIAVQTQRHYQSVIRDFVKYITENVKYNFEVYRIYGIRLRQFCTEENMIPHVSERENIVSHLPLTREELFTVLESIDERIRIASRFSGKDLFPLMRDKAMFFNQYVYGLRAIETIRQNTTSFFPNPRLPELGRYGFAIAWGKGSNGSGPKERFVPLTHTELPELLDWYLEEVRPRLMRNADANEKALFMSERGNRISYSDMHNRFAKMLAYAGIDKDGKSTHTMRRTMATHQTQRLSMETIQRMLGHEYLSTTQIYTYIPDKYIDDEIVSVVSRLVNLNSREKK